MLRAILKYRHGSLPQSKLSCELAKQAVTTKCRDNIYAEPSRVFLKKPWISVPKIKICGQKEVRPQMVFIDHRLTQIDTD